MNMNGHIQIARIYFFSNEATVDHQICSYALTKNALHKLFKLKIQVLP